MQNLDNDMEELFREAAENYPLRVTGADWSKVQAALLQEHTPVKDAKTNRRRWLWSLLLLLIPFICLRLQYTGYEAASLIAAKTTGTFNEEPNEKTNNDKTIPPSNNSAIQPSNHPISTNTSTPARLNFLLAPIVIKQYKNATTQSSSHTAIQQYNHSATKPFSNTTIQPFNNKTIEQFNHSTLKPFTQSSRTKTTITAPLMEEEEDETTPATSSSLNIATTKQEELSKKDTTSIAATDKNKKKETEPAAKPTTTSEKQKQPSFARFYVSVLGGAGVSKVKTSKFEPAGKSIGISAGYNITKRFAVEAGAFWSTKNYSTKYKYFNNSKTQWPSIRIIETVHGSCQVIEVPVTLRYNFKPTAKHSFFAAAGLSSWIMKKEDYDYTYTTLLNPMQKSMYKSYYNSGRDWFSVLQLSAGWQRNVGKLGAVRVQSYYNLPLRGVGLGSLPVSGFGALAGFTFSLR
jgi:hypothetical protein